ncbi:MAG: chloride channel protein [Chlorobi bacterium]|nr:chloride channel protein [Chlorobiota bacterium]
MQRMNKKGNVRHRLRVLLYALMRKTRFFKGSPQQFLRMTLDSFIAQLNLNQDLPFLLVAVFVGLITGYVAVLFHESILFISSILFSGRSPSAVPDFGSLHDMLVLPLLPAVGGLLVGLYNAFVVKEKPEHGLASVIKAVAQKNGMIGRRQWIHKTVTSVISIGTGGGGGREAPIAQVGAALGSSLAQKLNFTAGRTRSLLGCGAAAGLASVFNAPLGGVMFAVEVILGDFSVHTFSPIVVAAVVGTVLSRSYLGASPTFQVPEYSLMSNMEFALYFLLGVFAGLSAVLFIRTFYAIEEFFQRFQKRFGIPFWAMPAIGGLLCGLLCLWLPALYGFSYEVIERALNGEVSWQNMVGVYILKPVVAALTVGSGGSGGMFAPAMKMGAMLGGMFGHAVNTIFPGMTAASGAYALVGMGALTAGIMRAPLTVILILFEITGQYEIVLPIMFAAVTASLVARLGYRHTMETYVLEKEGVKVGFGIALSIAGNISVRDVMRKNFIRFTDVTRVEKILDVFHHTPESNFFVMTEDGRFVGMIRLEEMSILLGDEPLSGLIADDVVKKDVPVLSDTAKLDEALKLFELSDYTVLPVVDPESGRLLGIVKQDEAFSYYRKQMNMYSADRTESSVV